MDGYIRWAAIEYDLDSIIDIDRQSYYYSLSKITMHKLLGNSNISCIVHEQGSEGKRIISAPGLVTGYTIYRAHTDSIYILGMAVLCDSRRMGIGTRMLDYVIKMARHEKMNDVNLRVNERNLDAQLFLRKNKFKADTILYDCSSRSSKDIEPLYGMTLDLWESPPTP